MEKWHWSIFMENNSPWSRFLVLFCPRIIWYIITVSRDVRKKYYRKNFSENSTSLWETSNEMKYTKGLGQRKINVSLSSVCLRNYAWSKVFPQPHLWLNILSMKKITNRYTSKAEMETKSSLFFFTFLHLYNPL